MLYPALDGVFIALDGPPLGLLGTPAQPMEQATDMIHMVVHTESFLDHLCYARTGPQVRVKARFLRPPQQDSLQALSGFLLQFKLSSGCRLLLKTCLSLLAVLTIPPAHPSTVHPPHLGHFNRL